LENNTTVVKKQCSNIDIDFEEEEDVCADTSFDEEFGIDFSVVKKEEVEESVREWNPEESKPILSQNLNQFLEISDNPQKEEGGEVVETCNICGKTCGTKKLLRSHMLVHTSAVVKCPKCIPDRYLKEYGLKKHLRNCHKSKDIPCDIPGCPKMFKLREVMLRHIKSVHNMERTLCPHCGAAVINLSYHLEKCNRDNLDHITCKICNKQYASKMSLLLHEKSIHGPDTGLEVCTVCGKSVKDMKSHMKVNHSETNQRTMQCHVEGCKSMFRTKQEVTNHYNRVHLDIKAQCSICLQWLKNLPEHISQVHNRDRKHVCNECGKQFFKNSDLKLHIERVHTGKRYNCPECGRTVSKIREHMKVAHGISDIDMNSITVVTVNNVM